MMSFLRQAIAGIVLVTVTLCLQSGGMAMLIHWVRIHFARYTSRRGLLNSAEVVVRFTSVLISLHIAEVCVWAGFYRWICFNSWDSAFYFSAASYSTVGYGDVVLPRAWHNLGPLESITGVLMCGLSASFLFAVVTRLVERRASFGGRSAEGGCDWPPADGDLSSRQLGEDSEIPLPQRGARFCGSRRGGLR